MLREHLRFALFAALALFVLALALVAWLAYAENKAETSQAGGHGRHLLPFALNARPGVPRAARWKLPCARQPEAAECKDAPAPALSATPS